MARKPRASTLAERMAEDDGSVRRRAAEQTAEVVAGVSKTIRGMRTAADTAIVALRKTRTRSLNIGEGEASRFLAAERGRSPTFERMQRAAGSRVDPSAGAVPLASADAARKARNEVYRAMGNPLPLAPGQIMPDIEDVERASDLPDDNRVEVERPWRAYLPFAEKLTGASAEYMALLQKKENPQQRTGENSGGARGPWQFVEGTWRRTVGQHAEREGFMLRAYQPDELWEMAEDPKWSTIFAAHHQEDNAEVLRRKLGRNPTWREVYMGHFAGVDRAAALIRADKKRPATAFYRPNEIRANMPSFYPKRADGTYDRSRPFTVKQHIAYHAQAFPDREWSTARRSGE